MLSFPALSGMSFSAQAARHLVGLNGLDIFVHVSACMSSPREELLGDGVRMLEAWYSKSGAGSTWSTKHEPV